MSVKSLYTGQLGVLPGIGTKRVTTAVVEHINTVVMEVNMYTLTELCVPTISCTLGILCYPVRHIMHIILNFDPYKIQIVQQSVRHDPDALVYCETVSVDDSWPWIILLVDEAYFHRIGQVITHNW